MAKLQSILPWFGTKKSTCSGAGWVIYIYIHIIHNTSYIIHHTYTHVFMHAFIHPSILTPSLGTDELFQTHPLGFPSETQRLKSAFASRNFLQVVNFPFSGAPKYSLVRYMEVSQNGCTPKPSQTRPFWYWNLWWLGDLPFSEPPSISH